MRSMDLVFRGSAAVNRSGLAQGQRVRLTGEAVLVRSILTQPTRVWPHGTG